jgi:hypothetical protein
MKLRRWFGVFMIAWVALAPLFINLINAPAAEAASDTYKFDTLNNIVGTGAVNLTFTNAGNGTWQGSVPGGPGCNINYTITGVKPGRAAGATGPARPAPRANQHRRRHNHRSWSW